MTGPGRPADEPSKIIIVNAGSSSLKVRVLDTGNDVVDALDLDPWDGSPDHSELDAFLGSVEGAAAVGHRIVHGGQLYSGPVRIDSAVITAIGELADLAPLHQPRALAGIAAATRALPSVPGVACFDTAFHAGMPEAAAEYALPGAWVDRFGLRKFGFHGLSHGYAARRAAEMLGREQADLSIVTCHLGAGASLAAVAGGRCVDTTMGFTPLDGLVMATRSGSVDPGLLVWLLQRAGLTVADLSTGLEQASGLAGLARLPDGSGDMRAVRRAADDGQQAAILALEVYLHRLRREIAAMAAALNGLDVLVFTGGIGEHDTRTRAAAVAGLSFLGVGIDAELNSATDDADISDTTSSARVLVITAREDIEIARQVREVLADG